MKDDLSPEQTDAILKALDEVISEGPWDKSNFLKAIGKNLQGLREEFVGHIHALQEFEKKQDNQSSVSHEPIKHGQAEIFVSLYSSNGTVLRTWERILATLPSQIISRPIYAKEMDVKTMIKAKENKANEAYVSIFIDETDILPLSMEKTPFDKLGKPLLTLKDRALRLENIKRFVHISGEYAFVHGQLIKQTED